MEKHKTILHIGGRDYPIVSTDPVEHVQRIGVYVDRKIKETEAATKLPTQMATVFTCLSIADELMKAHDENTRLRRELMAIRSAKSDK